MVMGAPIAVVVFMRDVALASSQREHGNGGVSPQHSARCS
jgi:hypothetical protein